MKFIFIFFFIFVAAITNAVSEKNVDYKAIATDLLNKVTTLKNNADEIESELQDLQSSLQHTADALDYGISQNDQIKELLDMLQKSNTKRGIENCVNIKDNKIQVLKQELESIFIEKTNAQLNNNKLTVTAILQTLQSISDNIQGPNLDEEIKLCTNNLEGCRLTVEYPREIDHSKDSLNFLGDLTDSLEYNILKTAIYPILPDKINSEVYIPVTTCINKLL